MEALQANKEIIKGHVEPGDIKRFKLILDGRRRCTVALEGLGTTLKVRRIIDTLNTERATANLSPSLENLETTSNELGIHWTSFNSESGIYEIEVEAGQNPVDFELYATAANSEIPKFLKGGFEKPLYGEMTLTTEEYGHVGDPWGNEKEAPYFKGYNKYSHLGTDFIAKPGDTVRAMGKGKVVKVGHSGDQWGYHVVIEHEVEDEAGEKKIITVVYEHLQRRGRPKVGDSINAGQKIGKIWNMKVQGEESHLHLCAHYGPLRQKRGEKLIRSVAGAAPYPMLEGDLENFIDMSNLNLYKGTQKREGHPQAIERQKQAV